MPVALTNPVPSDKGVPEINWAKIDEIIIRPVQGHVLVRVSSGYKNPDDGAITRVDTQNHHYNGDKYQQLLSASTEDGEQVGAAVKRIAYAALQGDELIPAGPVS